MNRATSATGWVRNPDGTLGWTLNPFTGCRNHIKGLCNGGGFPCYAYKLAHGRLRDRYLANRNVPPIDTKEPLTLKQAGELQTRLNDPFYPRLWPERLEEFSELAYKPKGIFVCDMSDLFGIGIPEDWTERVLNIIKGNPQHRFYLLTKQPQNLPRWSPFPDNCWVGVTATGYKAFNEALDYLKGIEAKVKYISVEPLLEAIPFYMERLAYCGINWIVIGSQTRPTVMPKIGWAQHIVEACDKAGVPVFLKDNLAPIMAKLKLLKVIDGQGLPRIRGDYTLRQELPIER